LVRAGIGPDVGKGLGAILEDFEKPGKLIFGRYLVRLKPLDCCGTGAARCFLVLTGLEDIGN
jgi:hypothetical protein